MSELQIFRILINWEADKYIEDKSGNRHHTGTEPRNAIWTAVAPSIEIAEAVMRKRLHESTYHNLTVSSAEVYELDAIINPEYVR